MPVRVLVVEDDPITLELIADVLTSLGARVRSFVDSQRADTVIHQEKFDGIFLDLVMPKLDGFQLARRIRQSSLNRRTPIMIVTGLIDKRTIEKAFAAGATFFLEKPLDRQKLTRLLESTRGSMLAERRRLRRVPVSIQVTCRLDSRTITGMSYNVSEGGILFQGDGSIQPGDRVELSFRLPNQRVITQGTGTVARVDQHKRVGVEFTHINLTERQRIRRFVASLAESKPAASAFSLP